jgi:nicotinamide mononucleotide transporter
MTLAEIIGVALGVACVYLTVRENNWCWPIGIANNLMFIAIFIPARLYADSGLQVIYIVLGLYGWYEWLYGGKGKTALPISLTPPRAWIVLAAIAAGSTLALTELLRRLTDSNVAFWDALTTVLSLTAQFMLAKKWLENWWVWICANTLYIGLYVYKQLYLVAALQLVFIALSLMGYVRWQREYRRAAAPV